MVVFEDLKIVQKGFVLWFTGLSGAGKSTLAKGVYEEIKTRKIASYLIDGDTMRQRLSKDLSYSRKDRSENIRRASELAWHLVDAGIITIAAFISPYKVDRENIRVVFNPDEFLEIYVKCSLEVCESRDPKGLYKMAREGLIKEFTGVTDPYEVPECPDLVVDTTEMSVFECIDQIITCLKLRKLL